MKENLNLRSRIQVVLAMGAVWGLSEALAGMWLQRCAFAFSGAILTGLAFFYISFVWTVARKAWALLLLLGVAVLFKMLDAFFLAKPLLGGAVINPVYAFVLETLAFLMLVSLFRHSFHKKNLVRLGVGAGSALLATMAFPTAGWFTGVAACLYPGTQIPLSVFTAPLAVILSVITVSAGYLLALQLDTGENRGVPAGRTGLVRQGWPSLVVFLCLLILALVRMA